MNLKTESYKGYAVKFVEKIMANQKLVVGEFPSIITGRMLGTVGSTKELAFNNVKKMIDKEVKIKGIK